MKYARRMLKAIIFDLDGVIVDSHELHKRAWKELLDSIGREVPEEELDFVIDGRKRHEILRHFLGDLPAEEAERHGMAKQQLFRRSAAELQTIPGVVDFIQEAQQLGVAIAVGTSASRSRAHGMLEQFGLASHFAAVVTADDVATGKPDPAVFQMAASKLATSSENVLVCEDAVAGVEGAKRAGMRCLAIAANGRRALLEGAGADWVVKDFTKIRVQDVERLFRSENKALSRVREEELL